MLSAEEAGGVDISRYLAQLDGLAAAIRPRLPESPLDRLTGLARYLFEELGFSGDVDGYHRPDNSRLDRVLDSRRGIPITLGVLMMEVGRRVGVPLVGVGFPMHFLLAHTGFGGLYVDPFWGGRLLTEGDAEALLAEISSGRIAFSSRLLEPVGSRRILLRILENLKGAHLRTGSVRAAYGSVERAMLLAPSDLRLLCERGLLQLQLGAYLGALRDLGVYLREAPEADDREEVAAWLEEARQRVKAMN